MVCISPKPAVTTHRTTSRPSNSSACFWACSHLGIARSNNRFPLRVMLMILLLASSAGSVRIHPPCSSRSRFRDRVDRSMRSVLASVLAGMGPMKWMTIIGDSWVERTPRSRNASSYSEVSVRSMTRTLVAMQAGIWEGLGLGLGLVGTAHSLYIQLYHSHDTFIPCIGKFFHQTFLSYIHNL